MEQGKSLLSLVTREERADAFYKLFSNMSLLELNSFIEAYGQRFNVSVGVPQQITQQAEQTKQEQVEFSVFLLNMGANKIETMKLVKTLTLITLKEAKDIIECTVKGPQLIKGQLTKLDAETYVQRFSELGAEAKIE
jgi:large subunit ribosomal protein L7/L12